MPGRGCPAGHEPFRNLAGLVAPFRYAGSGGRAVRRFKLDGDPAAGLFLTTAMRRAWRAGAFGGWRRILVVPVPMHPKKVRERGFDQADWLARRLHWRDRRRRWEVGPVLERVRNTRGQGDPRTTSRERNVRDAFAFRAGASAAGRRVVLVDDVFTSGATMRECARLLRRAGATQVVALAACRA
ncbi:MAG: phosphoribosyltransferase family protein [bacterium]|nr:phosphoribosyltransferase family protein [bacterium]